MVDLILTEAQQIQCSTQILDLMLKAAVAGAVACVIWNALVVKDVFKRDAPSQWLRNRFSRKSPDERYTRMPKGGVDL